MPASPPLARVDGVPHPVCCQGCRAAAEWIAALGLGDYYRLREGAAMRPPDAAESRRSADAFARPELARHVVRAAAGGRAEVVVLVDGLRCAACCWLIERALGAVPGVANVAVNAGARRARIVFDPARTALPAIVDAFARVGYRALPLDAAALDDARLRESRAAMKRLAVAGFGAMQAMMYGSALWFGAFDDADLATRDFFRWLGFLVTTPVVAYAAAPFFGGALRLLRGRRLGMDVPIALAIALIYAGSAIQAIVGGTEVYFESVSMFVFLLSVGRYLEMRARHRAGDLGDAMARAMPMFADRIDGGEASPGTPQRVGACELVVGDRVMVAAGAGVPADGVLESAQCRVDEALITGESAPASKRRGDPLCAGSVVVDSALTMRVTRTGGDTVLSAILALVARAASERPRIAVEGERVAAWLVASVLVLATLTAVAWSIIEPSRAFAATVAVLVVTCPCAFALAAPAAVTRAIGVLAARGVLVVRPDALEALAGVTHVLLDKTGTLTQPWLEADAIEVLRDVDRGRALSCAAALAQASRHPLAQAIAAANVSPLPPVAAAVVVAGRGVEGIVDGCAMRLGRAEFALPEGDVRGVALDDAVVLADNDGAIAAFRLRERLRDRAGDAVDALRAAGLDIAIASGDAAPKVAAVAATLGVTSWRARMQPADKLEWLAGMRASGARILAIGDGINDAPLLAGADVAAALASGAAIAQAASDVVLAGDDLRIIAGARAVACETLAVVRENQRWALVYNALAVPLAACGFVPPWLAALGMSASSLVVVLHALRIGRDRRAAPAPAGDAPQAAPA